MLQIKKDESIYVFAIIRCFQCVRSQVKGLKNVINDIRKKKFKELNIKQPPLQLNQSTYTLCNCYEYEKCYGYCSNIRQL